MASTKSLVVVPYDPLWAALFETERLLLQALLVPTAQVHHIGSTAVPGLIAKPIIDILVEMPDLRQLDALATEFVALGYEARGENGIVCRRYYTKGAPQRTHHLHAYAQGSPEVLRHLALRDHLRRDDTARARYSALKQMAIAACGSDVRKYAQYKASFVSELEAQALGISHSAG